MAICKNLNAWELGISGRQSELIELAMTHGYRSLSIDVDEYLKRAESQSVEQAARFLKSARLHINSFELPINWRCESADFPAQLEKLKRIAAATKHAGADACHVTVLPGSDTLPYHENFEMHRQRLGQMAELLADFDHRLGVAFRVLPSDCDGYRFEFIHDADAILALIKSAGTSKLGLHLDTWNWYFAGGTFQQVKDLASDQITSLVLADAPPNLELATATVEDRRLPFDPPSVDNASVLEWAHEVGVNAAVTLGVHPSNFLGMNRDEVVRKCTAVLDDLWAAAGISTSRRTVSPAESS